MQMAKILFLAANPSDTTKLRLDNELREIEQKIRAAKFRDSLELISCWAVRPDDLLQTLNEHQPQVVHFSGHGVEFDGIVLEDERGKASVVSDEALVSLFKTLKDNIRLVLFNACHSQRQAEAITKVIDFAIGMNKAIGDDAATVFSSSFYRALGFGRSVQEAFDQGKTGLRLMNIPEAETPELHVRVGADAMKAHLCPMPEPTRERRKVAVDIVTLRIRLDYEDFDQNVKKFVIYRLAEYLDISPNEIEVESAMSESVRVSIKIPLKIAKTLSEAYDKMDPGLIVQMAPLVLLEPHRGHWLCLDPKTSDSFFIILGFAKKTHHVFQEIEATHTSTLVNQLSGVVEQTKAVHKLNEFQNAWINYTE